MAPSSSTKKAARLTQRGKGRKVRFQGGTVFPAAVAVTLVLGIGTIVYARQSQPEADASPPTIDDHWHAAYGFYVCGEWYQLQGNKEETNAQGQLVSTEFLQTGIHSHDDGVIHWHPFTARAVGKRAKLGVFLDVYDVQLGDEKLSFPDNQPVPAEGTTGGSVEPGAELVEGDDECDGDDAELSVVVWDSYLDTDDGTTYIANFDEIGVANDGMVFSIAFMPRDATVPMPPWATQLPELGVADQDQAEPTTTIAGESTTTVAGGSTTTVLGSTPAEGTEPASTSTTTPAATTTTSG